jgi:hypothetical protein
MKIELVEAGEALALQLIERNEVAAPVPSLLDEHVAAVLAAVPSPMPFDELRCKCHVRTATLYEWLAALTAMDRIAKSGDGGYRLVSV